MRAIVIHGKLDLRTDELTAPEPREGDVPLRMAYGGICGSDLHNYDEGANGEFVVREPLVPGHEVSGTVEHDPSGALAPGTPVTVHPATFGTPQPRIEDRRHLWPGGSYLGSASTWPHTQGGMQEQLVVRRDMVRVLPAELPLLQAALAEPQTVGLHGLTIAGDVGGARVLVSGSGPIGLLTAAGAPARCGGGRVHRRPPRPAAAGARARRARHRAGGRGGRSRRTRSTSSWSVPGCRRRSCPPWWAPGAPLVSKQLQLRAPFRFDDEIDEAVTLLSERPGIESVITHVVPADQAVDAFAAAKESEASGRVVVALWPADDVSGSDR